LHPFFFEKCIPVLGIFYKPYYSANHPVQHMGATVAPLNTPNPLSGTWKPTTVFPGTSPTSALLLTDGSVIVQDQCTANWYRLVPDATGLYDTGTWSAYAAGDGGGYLVVEIGPCMP
jgi:hypothetical protein